MCLLCMSSPMDFMGTACWLEMQLVCAQGSGSSRCSRAVPGSKTTWIELKGNCWKPLGKACYVILSLVCHVLFKVWNIFVSKWLHLWVCLSKFFLMSPRNLDYLDFFFPWLNFPYSHLLYSCNPFCAVFIFPGTFCSSPVTVLLNWTGFVLSFFQPVQLGWPSWDFVHSALSSSSLLTVGSSCPGAGWPHRETEPAPHPAPPRPAKTASEVGTGPGEGAGHTGYFIRVLLSSFSCWGCCWSSLLSPGCRGGG